MTDFIATLAHVKITVCSQYYAVVATFYEVLLSFFVSLVYSCCTGGSSASFQRLNSSQHFSFFIC